jgi:menaquinone-dependent protoporphyrinogen oxidase
MSTLVAYASKYGSTEGIAERIAATLKSEGLQVDSKPIEAAGDVAGYESFVIGSAVYAFHWTKPAAEFVRRHRSLLAGRPVWLFSVGPLGPKADGAVKPRDFAELSDTINARDHHLFYGAIELSKLKGTDRLFGRMFKSFQGDFRDWEEIDAWARRIAHELADAPAAKR